LTLPLVIKGDYMNRKSMTSREIISRVIERKEAPRIGFDFNYPHQNDFVMKLIPFSSPYKKYENWGRYPEILEKVPDFTGEVKLDFLGNICGRVGMDIRGECIKGVLQDDWGLMDNYEFPEFDPVVLETFRKANLGISGKFIVFEPPVSIFSTLRDMRLMDNALADTVLEPDCVRRFLNKVQKVLLKSVEYVHEVGGQALILYDDWGMQHAPFISPQSFADLFKPVYSTIADELHNRNMKFFVHSCGLVWDLIPHFIEAGIDVLQFDQPELSGSENLARTFGKQVTIYSPVDIQKIMSTGNRELIEATAHNMVEVFKKYADGAFIAKDYPAWEDITVDQEWATWARNVFLNEGWNI